MPKESRCFQPREVRETYAKTGLSRKELAEKLRLNKQTLDRWASTGVVGLRNWQRLLSLIKDLPAEKKALQDVTTEELAEEIKRRGFILHMTYGG